MSSIYRHAARVIIWLGPRWTEREDVAAEAIQDFVQRQRSGSDSQKLSRFLETPVHRPDILYTGGHWPALVDFFDRPWWRRVWVR